MSEPTAVDIENIILRHVISDYICIIFRVKIFQSLLSNVRLTVSTRQHREPSESKFQAIQQLMLWHCFCNL